MMSTIYQDLLDSTYLEMQFNLIFIEVIFDSIHIAGEDEARGWYL